MPRLNVRLASAISLLILSSCDNTYTPSAHRSADASTGSMLSGVDTGMDPGTDLNNPSLRNNNTHPAGGK